MWFSDNIRNKMSIDLTCLKNKVWNKPSHDNLFHTILGITRTKTKLYKENLDMISNCIK